MATKVLVPLLGEGVEEVTVTRWLKKEGDSVNELEPLLEVNTDKVDTEIPAPASGTVLKILAEEGVPAKVGAVLALIGKPGESVEVSGTQVPSVRQSGEESPPVKANVILASFLLLLPKLQQSTTSIYSRFKGPG
jgi:pyruvate dehydrogenase E2 component (dihydrolipoyllysine-residue acetyltransferase)